MFIDLTLVSVLFVSRLSAFRTLGNLPRLFTTFDPPYKSLVCNPGWLAIARAFTEPELMELQSVKDDSVEAMSKT